MNKMDRPEYVRPATMVELFNKQYCGRMANNKLCIDSILAKFFNQKDHSLKCPIVAVFNGNESYHTVPSARKINRYECIPSLRRYIRDKLYLSEEQRLIYAGLNSDALYGFLMYSNFVRTFYGNKPKEHINTYMELISREIHNELNRPYNSNVSLNRFKEIVINAILNADTGELRLNRKKRQITDFILIIHLQYLGCSKQNITEFGNKSSISELRDVYRELNRTGKTNRHGMEYLLCNIT